MAGPLSLCPRERESEREKEEGEGPVLIDSSDEGAHERSAVLLLMFNLEETCLRAKELSM